MFCNIVRVDTFMLLCLLVLKAFPIVTKCQYVVWEIRAEVLVKGPLHVNNERHVLAPLFHYIKTIDT